MNQSLAHKKTWIAALVLLGMAFFYAVFSLNGMVVEAAAETKQETDSQGSFFLAEDKKIYAEITDMRVTEDGAMEWDVLFENKSGDDMSARLYDVYLNDWAGWTDVDLSDLAWVRIPAHSKQELTMVCDARLLRLMKVAQLNSFGGSVLYGIGFDEKVFLPFAFEAEEKAFLTFDGQKDDAATAEDPAEEAPVKSLTLGDASADIYYGGTKEDKGFYLIFDIRNDGDQTVVFRWKGSDFNNRDNGSRSFISQKAESGEHLRTLHLAKVEKDMSVEEIYKMEGEASLAYDDDTTEDNAQEVVIYPQGEEAWEQYQPDEEAPEGLVLLDDENMTVSVTAGDMFPYIYLQNHLDEKAVLQITFIRENGSSDVPRDTVIEADPKATVKEALSYSLIMMPEGSLVGKEEVGLRMKLRTYTADAYAALPAGGGDAPASDSLAETEVCVRLGLDGTAELLTSEEYDLEYPSDDFKNLPLFWQPWTDSLSEENLEDSILNGRWMDVGDHVRLMVPPDMIDCTREYKPYGGKELKLALKSSYGELFAMVLMSSIPDYFYNKDSSGLVDLNELVGDDEEDDKKVVMAGGNPAIMLDGDIDEDGENDTLYLILLDEENDLECQLVINPNIGKIYFERCWMLLNSFSLKK